MTRRPAGAETRRDCLDARGYDGYCSCMVYFDYNATTPVLAEVRDAMLPYLSDRWGNASSAHVAGRRSRDAIEEARGHIASLICASRDEIVFTSGATESNQTALRTFLDAGSPVVCSAVEHPSVLSLVDTDGNGGEVALVPVDADGQLVCSELQTRIDQAEQPGLVSLIWANNETGILSPVDCGAEIAKTSGWRVHLDGAQMVGKLPVDVSHVNADYLSLSAHKMYGPPGVGALYVRSGSPHTALIQGLQEKGRRGGTEPVALIVGFGEAARLASLQMADRYKDVLRLRDLLEAGLGKSLSNAIVNGQKNKRLPNTTSVTLAGVDGEVLVSLLSERGFCVSTSSACKSSVPTPSHVLLAMGRSYEDAGATLRISLSHLTGLTFRTCEDAFAVDFSRWRRSS